MRALVLVLALSLAGCATTRETVKIVPVPAELTEPVPEPQLEGNKNDDLVTWIARLQSALRLANQRLESISRIKP